jgi:RNA recognition motif-containing protein
MRHQKAPTPKRPAIPTKRELYPSLIAIELAWDINSFFSLYCTNLPDKLRKHDLRSSLYTLFSTYGTVLDVVAMKTSKMRGQAHIVFKDVQASTQALRALQGFDFFGKQMVRHSIRWFGTFQLTIDSRKLSMRKARPMFSPSFAVHMSLLSQSNQLFPPTCKSPFSVDPLVRSPHDRT